MVLDLCDIVNSDWSEAHPLLRAVRKQLASRVPRTRLFTLTVVDALLSNCGPRMHRAVVERGVLAAVAALGESAVRAHTASPTMTHRCYTSTCLTGSS